MKQNDTMKDLFQRLQGSFDLHETPDGHQRRFLERLTQQQTTQKARKFRYWHYGSVAAVIILLVLLGGALFTPTEPQEADLASISPEMEQTQSFFTTTINSEMRALEAYDTPETKKIVEEALVEVQQLEVTYQQLKKDLLESGNNERVISAMINNFQNRITILQQVSETIETIKTLKNNSDETFL